MEWGIGFLRRGRSFVGMTILGVVVFGMGDWVLTQRSLLRRDDKVWVGGWFGMGDWVLTQRSLLRRDDNFGWVVGLEWVICFLRRGPSFVGMTILSGWLVWNGGLGTYAEVPSLSG